MARIEVFDQSLHELLAVNPFTAAKFGKAYVDSTAKLLQLNVSELIFLLHEAKCFSHNFAGRVVSAGFHFAVDELLKLRG